MPRSKSGVGITTNLLSKDAIRLDQVAREKGSSRAQIVRSAILFYLDHHEAKALDERESKLEGRLKRMEDRLASMMMRSNIDIGVVYNAIYYNMGANADKAFAAFYSQSVKRLQSKRKDNSDKIAVGKLVNELYQKDDANK